MIISLEFFLRTSIDSTNSDKIKFFNRTKTEIIIVSSLTLVALVKIKILLVYA